MTNNKPQATSYKRKRLGAFLQTEPVRESGFIVLRSINPLMHRHSRITNSRKIPARLRVRIGEHQREAQQVLVLLLVLLPLWLQSWLRQKAGMFQAKTPKNSICK